MRPNEARGGQEVTLHGLVLVLVGALSRSDSRESINDSSKEFNGICGVSALLEQPKIFRTLDHLRRKKRRNIRTKRNITEQ